MAPQEQLKHSSDRLRQLLPKDSGPLRLLHLPLVPRPKQPRRAKEANMIPERDCTEAVGGPSNSQPGLDHISDSDDQGSSAISIEPNTPTLSTFSDTDIFQLQASYPSDTLSNTPVQVFSTNLSTLNEPNPPLSDSLSAMQAPVDSYVPQQSLPDLQVVNDHVYHPAPTISFSEHILTESTEENMKLKQYIRILKARNSDLKDRVEGLETEVTKWKARASDFFQDMVSENERAGVRSKIKRN